MKKFQILDLAQIQRTLSIFNFCEVSENKQTTNSEITLLVLKKGSKNFQSSWEKQYHSYAFLAEAINFHNDSLSIVTAIYLQPTVFSSSHRIYWPGNPTKTTRKTFRSIRPDFLPTDFAHPTINVSCHQPRGKFLFECQQTNRQKAQSKIKPNITKHRTVLNRMTKIKSKIKSSCFQQKISMKIPGYFHWNQTRYVARYSRMNNDGALYRAISND